MPLPGFGLLLITDVISHEALRAARIAFKTSDLIIILHPASVPFARAVSSRATAVIYRIGRKEQERKAYQEDKRQEIKESAFHKDGFKC